jgi:hypothetical protein
MPARIILKNGQTYSVDAHREDIKNEWENALVGHNPIVTYFRLHAGIPLPKVTIDLREVSSVEEERR